jgi:hypothetical protein
MIRNFGLVSPYTTNEGNDGNKNIKMSKTNKQGQVLLKRKRKYLSPSPFLSLLREKDIVIAYYIL